MTGMRRATGTGLILEERQRQIEEEGWTADHDDEHDAGEIAWAAVCYAAPDRVYVMRRGSGGVGHVVFADPWPWASEWDKRKKKPAILDDRIKELVKAGALIAAEIDRLLREWREEDRG